MDKYTATEQAYKHGYDKGYAAGKRDAVEVVRCKDCKWYRPGKYSAPIKFCYRLKGAGGEHTGYNFSDDDYCSRGERKDNGSKNS